MQRSAVLVGLATVLALPIPASGSEAGSPEPAPESSARQASEEAPANLKLAPQLDTQAQRRSLEPKLFDAGAYFAGLGGELVAVGLTVGLVSGVYLSLHHDSCSARATYGCDRGPEWLAAVLLAALVGADVAVVATPLLSTGLAYAAGKAGGLRVNFRAAYGIGYAGLGFNLMLTAGAMAIAAAASSGRGDPVIGTGIVVGALGLLVTPWLQTLALQQSPRVIVAPAISSRSAGVVASMAF